MSKSGPSQTSAANAAATAARDGHARLLAILARRTGDIAAAEDALQGAFLKALENWPKKGIPHTPEAWLLTAAKRQIIDASRRAGTASAKTDELKLQLEELAAEAATERGLPDRRLELLSVLAHPAIDEAVRTPLMLNVILGVTAEDIARLFAIGPKTMAQRLVRAKTKIRTAQIAFSLPDAEERSKRLSSVLDAIYGAATLGRGDLPLTDEAAYLAVLAAHLMPGNAEALGLAALILQSKALRQAKDEPFLPLTERNPETFDHEGIDRAEELLRRAARLRQPGRYQLEAAIGSAHIAHCREGLNVIRPVLDLYQRLLAVAPTLGAECSYAAALLKAGQAEAARQLLDRIADEAAAYQPYWAVRAQYELDHGSSEAAKKALGNAANLASDDALKAWLNKKLEDLG